MACREIVTWQWTKASSDQSKAVDMQDTRTPYLKLSNLEEGMYTFVLKVTDSSDQSSEAEVHVFVKPPSNKPPEANAGNDQVYLSLLYQYMYAYIIYFKICSQLSFHKHGVYSMEPYQKMMIKLYVMNGPKFLALLTALF